MEHPEVNDAKQMASEFIESWMSRTIAARSDLRFEDLHVNLVDRAFSPKQNWITGGVECFRIAAHIRDRHRWPFLVGMGFNLKGSVSRRGLTFQTLDQMQHELGESPPSLYLFSQPGAAILED